MAGFGEHDAVGSVDHRHELSARADMRSGPRRGRARDVGRLATIARRHQHVRSRPTTTAQKRGGTGFLGGREQDTLIVARGSEHDQRSVGAIGNDAVHGGPSHEQLARSRTSRSRRNHSCERIIKAKH